MFAAADALCPTDSLADDVGPTCGDMEIVSFGEFCPTGLAGTCRPTGLCGGASDDASEDADGYGIGADVNGFSWNACCPTGLRGGGGDTSTSGFLQRFSDLEAWVLENRRQPGRKKALGQRVEDRHAKFWGSLVKSEAAETLLPEVKPRWRRLQKVAEAGVSSAGPGADQGIERENKRQRIQGDALLVAVESVAAEDCSGDPEPVPPPPPPPPSLPPFERIRARRGAVNLTQFPDSSR